MLINGSQETFCTCTTMPRAKVELRNNENIHVSCFLNLFIVRKGRKTAENEQILTDADFDFVGITMRRFRVLTLLGPFVGTLP